MGDVVEFPGYGKLICGDALEVLRGMESGSVDAVVTDPPYGIGENARKVASRGSLARPRDYGEFEWDTKPCSPESIAEMRRVSNWQIIFGGNYFELPPASCWLVWDKLNTGDFADCELAWTNMKKAIRRIQHRWNGMIREGNEDRFHPTQKPLKVMRWCVKNLPEICSTILDPFMGSGTTCVAAAMEGRKFIGIEIDPKYFEIARKRVEHCIRPGMFSEASA